jgi:hypothetical protein
MILEAIEVLDDKNGSNKTAISTFIEEKYEGLPAAHASLLTANLASMKESGKLAFVKNNYLKPDTGADADAEPTPAKRGRGRTRKDPNAPRPPPKDPNAPKRGRGRPPKAKDPLAEAVAKATSGMPKGRGRPPAKKAKVAAEPKAAAPAADASGSAPAKRGRGRPPKAK